MQRILKALAGAVIACSLVFLGIACDQPNHGRLGRRTMQFHGVDRGFLIYVPRTTAASAPVVFNLHGYGSFAAMQMEYSGMNAVADTAGFIVVYPNAVEHRWNSGIGENPAWPTPDVDDVGFMDAIIDTLASEFAIDLQRVYVCGMSNGGFMSYRLACRLSHRIAAAASVAGVMSQTTARKCEAELTVPLLHIHGTADRTVPYHGAPGWCSAEESIRHWAEATGCTVSDTTLLDDTEQSDGCRVVRVGFADSTGGEAGVFYKVIGGGHTWPGATFDLPGAGATCRDINASEEIWRFFKSR